MANLPSLDLFLFAVLPYISVFTFFLVTIRAYRVRAYTYSSLSSQFLENQQHFWGMVPFHYGILVVLGGHLLAFLFPAQLILFNSRPVRLYILEVSALIFALLTLVGLVSLIVRRMSVSKVRKVTTQMDLVLLGMLLVQVVSGIYNAVVYPWVTSWFAASVSPYLWTLVQLNPDYSSIAAMPWAVKLHLVNAFLVIGIMPYTRMAHVLVVPNPYLWRKYQVVRWYRAPGVPFQPNLEQVTAMKPVVTDSVLTEPPK